jgi:hypothetical protein
LSRLEDSIVASDTDSNVRTYGWLLAGIVLTGLTVRLVLSATSVGTDDVFIFAHFAKVVRNHGPIAIYHFHFMLPYNHPPLIGPILVVVNWLHDQGLNFAFSLRLVPILADCGTTLVMAAIFRRHFGPRKALLIASAIALNPVLILISGFHGNLDTLFCFLLLLSLYLMVERRNPLVAGAAGAAALGVKLVPLVVIPLIVISTRNRKDATRYTASLAVVSALIWGPTLWLEWHGALNQIFAYRGLFGNWGIGAIASLLGVSHVTLNSVRGWLGAATTAFSTLVGIWYVIRVNRNSYAAAGLTLALMLFLLPGWGDQYMAWPMVFVFFIDPGLAVLYSLVAGVFLFEIYTLWSGGFPWYREAMAAAMDDLGTTLGLVAWVTLAGLILYAIVRPGDSIDSIDSIEVGQATAP